MSIRQTKNKQISLALLSVCFSFSLLGSTLVSAEEIRKTSSYGAEKKVFTEQFRKNYVEQSKTLLLSDQVIGKSTGKTRKEIQQLKQQLIKTTNKTDAVKGDNLVIQKSNSFNHEFSIYDAHSHLISDDDFDGFYQTFSVTFDADFYNYHGYDIAEVYAELYLSQNGGPWIHYFTTDNFTLHSDSSTDDYEVITTLYDGYQTDYYDVLIDLYEVGYTDVVATISSDDTDALYALPLESVNFDYYEEVRHSHSNGHGGSISFIAVLILLSAGFRRYVNLKTQ